MDLYSPEKRSKLMSGIRGKNTKPEMLVRRYLHANGFRYLLHYGRLPGHPDIVLPKYQAIIFVHGCFWHHHENCRFAVIPKSKTQFWIDKMTENRNRDKKIQTTLEQLGWRIFVVWECMLSKKDIRERTFFLITSWLKMDICCIENTGAYLSISTAYGRGISDGDQQNTW